MISISVLSSRVSSLRFLTVFENLLLEMAHVVIWVQVAFHVYCLDSCLHIVLVGGIHLCLSTSWLSLLHTLVQMHLRHGAKGFSTAHFFNPFLLCTESFMFTGYCWWLIKYVDYTTSGEVPSSFQFHLLIIFHVLLCSSSPLLPPLCSCCTFSKHLLKLFLSLFWR